MHNDDNFDMYTYQAPAESAPWGLGQPQHATSTSTPLPANQDGTPFLQSPQTAAQTTSRGAYQNVPIKSNQHSEASPRPVLSQAPHFTPQVTPHLRAQAGRFIHVSKWAYGLGPSPPHASASTQQSSPRQSATAHGMTGESLPAQTASHLVMGVSQAYQQDWPAALTPPTPIHTPPTPTFNQMVRKRLYGEIEGEQTAMPLSSPHQHACDAGQGGPKRQKTTNGHDVARDAGHGGEQRAENGAVDDLEFQSLAEAQHNQHSCVPVLPETAARDKIAGIHESNSKQREWVKAIVNVIGGDYQQLPGGEHHKFPGHVQEWQRFQGSNLAKVRKAMQEKGKKGIELAAWAVLRAVLKGHSRGLRQTGTWTVDKRSTVTERLQKCVRAIQELPIVALDTLKGQGVHEFAANPESFAKRKIGNLWVNYYKKLAAKGNKIPKEVEVTGEKLGDDGKQQNVARTEEERDDDDGASIRERATAAEGEVEEN
ncbi:hypothetical protein KC347_g2039 [Hortaea werneckii]|nr:hypothetical protein KC347_g2039 [Hortaea werneckii]